MSESRHVLTVKEAATLARVSPAAIRRWYRRGYLDAFQVDRSATIRIPRDALQKLYDDEHMPRWSPDGWRAQAVDPPGANPGWSSGALMQKLGRA